MTYIKKKLSSLPLQLSCVVLLTAILFNNVCFGQATNTNQGKDFWFSYLATYDETNVADIVNITSSVNTSGTITIPGSSYTKAFTVTAGQLTRDTLPSADVVQTANFGTAASQAVNVTSNDNISVYASIEYSERSENTCILPVPLLGNQYYVMDYTPISGLTNALSEVMVIAQGCPDSVQITPTADLLSGQPAGVPFTVELQSGQIYQVQSDGDLTGTEVLSLSHSETAVMAGIYWTLVAGSNPSCSPSTGNPLYEEEFPVNTWGENYIFVATPGANDQCRILAETNNTTVTIYGSSTYTVALQAGGYYDTAITSATIGGAPIFISANNPISVGRILVSQDCNGTATPALGDPSFAMVNANEQMFLKSSTFYADNEIKDIDTNYLQVITRTPDVNTVFLDGINIGNLFVPVGVGPTAYSYASVGVRQGAHTLTSTGSGFLAYATGFGSDVDAVACDAGVYLKNINSSTDTNVSVTISSTPPSPPCSGNNGTATATAIGIPPFLYSWSNGQTNATATGLSAGTYKVVVSDSDCPYRHTDSATVFIAGGKATVSISAIPDSICPGNSTTISVVGGTSYSWSAPGSSNFSTSSSIEVTPTITTTYSVNVGNGSCSNIDTSITVTVKNVTGGKPSPSFIADTACQGYATQFTNTSNPISGNGVKFYWDFYNNGYIEDSTDANPQWLYKDVGTYTVSLTEVNNADCGGSATYTTTVAVDSGGTQSKISQPFTFLTSNTCLGTPSEFINSSPDTIGNVNGLPGVKYIWHFGDPASGTADTSTSTTPTHTYNTPGNYTVTLWPVKPIPCHDSASLSFTILPLLNGLIASNYDCGSNVVTFTDLDSLPIANNQLTGEAYYEWTIYNSYYPPCGGCGNDTTPGGYIANSGPVSLHPYIFGWTQDTGSYTIVLEVLTTSGSGYCINPPDTAYITLGKPLPEIYGKTPICQGSETLLTASGGAPYTWTWSWGPGSSTSDTLTVSKAGTYSVTSNSGTCFGDTTFTLAVNPVPVASVTQKEKVICQGKIDTLIASGGPSYEWKWAVNSQTDSAATDTIVVNPAIETIYSVTVSKLGCQDSTKDTVSVNSLPAPQITQGHENCALDSITLEALGGASYKWSNSSATTDSIHVSPILAASYSVTVTDVNGCSASTSTFVNANTPSSLVSCCDTTIQLGASARLNATNVNISNYKWTSSTPSVNIACNTCATITVTPTVTTTYSVTGINPLGCPVSASVIVTVESCDSLIVPNVFTPTFAGVSGTDNVLYIKGAANVSSGSLYIYDRWGKEMYTTSNLANPWTGTSESGGQAPDGVYYYIITVTCEGTTYKKHGFVQLIR